MQAFDIHQVLQLRQQADHPYLEFFRLPELSLGVYALPAGADDPQRPHASAEVYFVLEGRGVVRVADEDRPVSPGCLVVVGAGVEHCFREVTQELKLLVFFAPAE
jgi:mannose-6-phosphate isomerase-like protein (cupin superfamily)